MDVLQKLTFRTLKLNPKRTIVTIIGIVLSTALITAVANMSESFRESLIAYEKSESGDYHYRFEGVSQENRKYFEENRNIEKLGYVRAAGYGLFEESQNPEKPYLYLYAMDENGAAAAAIHLAEGRLPQAPGELALCRQAVSATKGAIGVGDSLELITGYRDGGEGYRLGPGNPYYKDEEQFRAQDRQRYTVVGIIEQPGNLDYVSFGSYSACVWLDAENCKEPADLYATYTDKGLQNRTEVTAGLMGISPELYQKYSDMEELTKEEREQVTQISSNVACNIWLLKWQLLLFSGGAQRMLYGMAALAILVIMAASVFCIRSSFAMALTEKMRMYGMISSVGATKKQRKRLVHLEALALGLWGIPLGILCGILASAVIVGAIGGLMEFVVEIPLVFTMSVPAMLLAALLSGITLYLSAGQSARKAGRLSPISAVRSGTEEGIRRKEVRIPRFVGRLFGIGGVIAYKNLRRARGKYRTTVVSIGASVAVFIGLTTFTGLAFRATGVYYDTDGEQLAVRINGDGAYRQDVYEKAVEIAGYDGVESAEVRRMSHTITVPAEQIPFNQDYIRQFPYGNEVECFSLVSIGESGYRAYCGRLGISPEEAKDRAILVADYREKVVENGTSKYYQGMMYDYQPGDVIRGQTGAEEQEETVKVELELIMATDQHPMSLGHYGGAYLVVSDDWMERHQELLSGGVGVYIRCQEPDALEEVIRQELSQYDFYISNQAREYRKNQSMYLLVAIFLYGFITVITLIGVTNIFNTVTTNMELRGREFAMLRSVGMTGREFRRMIRLETLFYGGKALLLGIPAGLLLSVGFHRALSQGIETAFYLPWAGILISVAAVFLLLALIMGYSMSRLNRKNIIEAVRSENV